MYTLYEFYDKSNNLLYIGITDNFPRRLNEHQKSKHWYGYIANIALFYFNSRGELEEQEKQRIKNTQPLFNIIYNTDNLEQSVIDYCVNLLKDGFIFENNKVYVFDMFEYKEVQLYTFLHKLFECVEYIIPDISFTSVIFKSISGEVIKGIENLS